MALPGGVRVATLSGGGPGGGGGGDRDAVCFELLREEVDVTSAADWMLSRLMGDMIYSRCL